MIRPGAHPLWVLVSPDCWGCLEAAKFRASCGRQVWVLSLGLGPRCGWVSRSTAKRFTKAPGLSQPSEPPLPSGGSRVQPQPHPHPLPRPLTTANLPASPAPQSSAAAIGPSRRGGVGHPALPWPSPPLAPAPLRLAAGSTSLGLGRPAPGRQRLVPPPRGPASLGARSPQPRGPPHSLSRSMNCQSAPGGC